MKWSLVLFLMVLSTACIKEKKETNVISGGSIDSTYHGRWERCEIDGSESIKHTLVISSNSVVTSNVFYDNTVCDDDDKIFGSGVNYTVTASSPVTLYLTQATFTPFETGLDSAWNLTSYCQITNWASGVPSNITNKDCDGITFATGETYEISFSRTGNTLTYEVDGEVSTAELVP